MYGVRMEKCDMCRDGVTRLDWILSWQRHGWFTDDTELCVPVLLYAFLPPPGTKGTTMHLESLSSIRCGPRTPYT